MSVHQLECRIVVTRGHRDRTVEVGMYDPGSLRYEPLGRHGPDERDVDKFIAGLKGRIEREGHRLTWCERSVGWGHG